MARSNNVVFTRLWLSYINHDKAGRQRQTAAKRLRSLKEAHQPKLADEPSMALGPFSASMLQLASFYNTLNNGGIHFTPWLLEMHHGPHGSESFQPSVRYALHDPDAAKITVQALEGVIDHGTGTAAQLSGREAAGKTGTTTGPDDVLFVGFIRQMTPSHLGRSRQRLSAPTQLYRRNDRRTNVGRIQ